MTYRKVLALAALAAALVIVGCASVQSQWNSTVATNTIPEYQKFAADHPKSVYADSAQMAIERLKFEAADKEHTIPAYQGFVKDNPKSMYVAKANDRIDQLQYNAATTTNTMGAYKDFIAAHPGSPHVAEAQQAIAKLKANMIAKEPAAAQEVLARYPAAAKKGEIPAKYVGNRVMRDADGNAVNYMLITSSYVIVKAIAGPDMGEQVFKPGNYVVGDKTLKLSVKMAYMPTGGDKSKMSIPLTITPQPTGLKVDAAQSTLTVKGKLTDMTNLIGVQGVQVKDNVKLTRQPASFMFVKAGV